MILKFLRERPFVFFVIKFILLFAVLYYGTLAVIGLSVPGGYYSKFVDNYLDYVGWIRSSLLHGSKQALSLFGIKTYLASEYNLRQVNGRGIRLVYECVGYGVMSFWIAFVVASEGKWIKKVLWVIGGLVFIWLLNITRLSLLLVATNKGWPMPLGWDHHTWFNIFAYFFIFIFMYLFNQQTGDRIKKEG